MRTAEEIFNQYLGGNHNIATLKPIVFYEMMNIARIEAIKECGGIIDEYKSIYTAGDRPIKTEIQVEMLKLIDQVK